MNMNMKKYLLVFGFIFLLQPVCLILFAGERLDVVKRGKQTITFDPIEVPSGSLETQIIIIKSGIRPIFTDITGFADIAGNYGKYKRQLPITSTFDNPSHYFIVSIAYSENDKSIICLQECWNTSGDTYEFPELQFNLEWYLLKNKSL